MANAKKQRNPDDDFLKVGPDATATFDNSPSSPTEHASSENLKALEDEDEDLDDEDLDEDEEYEEEDDEEEEYDDEDDDDEEGDEDEEEEYEDEEDEEDHDLAKSPRAPNVHRKL